MKRKSILIAVTATVALATTALAAGPGGKRHGNPEKMLAKMTETLGLYDDQVPQVEAILKDAADKRQAIGDSYTLNQRAEAREAMMQLRDETEAKLADVLTEEQLARMAELKAERKERRMERRLRRAERAVENAEES
ncbi:MAG: hypothetical protein AAAFM81_08240 [Pseudomonadota bacterium]